MPHEIAHRRLAWVCLALTIGAPPGCSTPLFRAQNPDSVEVAELVPEEDVGRQKLIGDLAVPYGLNHLRVESVALVTQLDGTGSDPPPSPMRDALKKEMLTHNVRRPEEAIASTNTAMVLVRGSVPPGAQKGDVFDIEVFVAPRTDTTSLRGGWLMSSRLREAAILDNTLHVGAVSGIAQGSILPDALFEKSGDAVLENRGRIPGGGIVQLERPLGLFLREEHVSVKTSALIGNAINARFFDSDRGTRRGVANPTRDNYIELRVHAQYKNNLNRFIQVIRHIAVNESPVERLARISELEKQLLEPATSQRAALQLEAIGREAVTVLEKGMASPDPEVRFYAAESLAYMDEGDPTPVLLEAARHERAFRWRAMLALSVANDFASQNALIELMDSSSAETRYGAYRAMRIRQPPDPIVRGEVLNDELVLNTISTTSEPMIHMSRVWRPEIVIFGQGQKLEAPTFFFAGKHFLVKRNNDKTVKITRFVPGGDDQHEISSTSLEEVIRTIARMGGSYADILLGVQEAKERGFLAARVEIDALPRGGRTYHRDQRNSGELPDSEEKELDSTEVIPELFQDRLRESREKRDSAEDTTDFDVTEPDPPPRSWFDRMTSWMVD